ncbi:hypothetical protein EON64_03980, partial [archaeon]
MNEAYSQVTSLRDTVQAYELWGANQTTLCSCFTGFSGADCSYRLCPKGDDPLTPHTAYYTMQLKAFARHKATGNFRVAFMTDSALFPAHDWTAEECASAFNGMKSIEEANCVLSNTDSSAWGLEYTFTITIRKWPVLPSENNLFSHTGAPDASYLSCDAALVNPTGPDARCSLTAVETTGSLPEYAFCSNRGLCDLRTGACQCFNDFTNSNCDTFKKGQSASQISARLDVLSLGTRNASFQDSILHLTSTTSSPKAVPHKMLAVVDTDSTNPVFTLASDGRVTLYRGGWDMTGNLTFSPLNITAS